MEGLTFTQYVSKHFKFILKLEGFDGFWYISGFVCGLNNKYKAKAKTHYPKMLEKAIKNA